VEADGRKHPSVPKVSAGTVNKQLGAVQAIAGWGYHTGLVPDDAQWLDPFKDMRLEEEQSTRAPFDTQDLQTIFNDPLFTKHELPRARAVKLVYGSRCWRCSRAQGRQRWLVSACST
jgi:hypothetical protein